MTGKRALKTTILGSARDCIVAIDQHGRIIEWNPATEFTFGHSLGATLGKYIFQVGRTMMTKTAVLFNSWRLLITGTLTLLLAATLVSASARAVGGDDPAQFVRAFGDRAIAMMADENLAAEQREVTFRRLLTEGFDVPSIGRFALGRYWRKASEEQRAEYDRLFEDMIVSTYSKLLDSYAGEVLEVGTVRHRDEKKAAVDSRILRAEGAPIQIDWRLRRAGDSWRIVDVLVEGVSMAIIQRSEFQAVVKASGGQIEGLLAKLREKTGRVESAKLPGTNSML